MAISGIGGSTSSYRENWENNGGIYGNDETGETEGTDKTQVWNAVFTDKSNMSVTADDFLKLMVTQLTNQDFMNPVDDSQYVTQMAQMTTMQQMAELANYSKTSYVMSLVGKNVTAAKITVSGELQKETGPVQKITLTNNEFAIYVNDKRFTMEQIMEVNNGSAASSNDTGTAVSGENRKNYLLSLIGREVVIGKGGDDTDDTLYYEISGIVEKVSSKDGEYKVFVNDEWHDMDAINQVSGAGKTETGEDE